MHHTFRAVIAVNVLTGLALASGAGCASATQSNTAIPLQEIQAHGVKGRLGLRLGTIMEVSGKVVPNTSKAKMLADEPFMLRITSMNGNSLKEPVLYSFGEFNVQENISPKIGDSFRFIGYETGCYEGEPDGTFKYVPSIQTTGFGFSTQFTVLAAK